MPGMTLSEKIIARAAGLARVTPGEIATCKVDLAMMHDSGGPRRVKPMLERLGAKPWDPDKIVLASDHYVPAIDAESARILDLTRKWAKEQNIARFHDMQGICHVLLQERGHLRPGMFAVGGDSHSTSGGAVGAFMIGIGATEMLGVLVTGEIWVKVPQTLRIVWSGRLADGVSAKDMMLFSCAHIPMEETDYRVVEFAGEAVRTLPMPERMTLANMAAELGAKAGLVKPDDVTRDYLVAAGAPPDEIHLDDLDDDPDARVEEVKNYDASTLAPHVAAPHDPANSAPASAHRGVAIDQAYIGACTGAKLVDLKMAARVLVGRKVKNGVRLLIAPASTRTTAEAAADGTLAVLTEAGAILLPSGCGACAGLGAGLLAEKEVCISSTARNFKGRMGASSAEVWLGSPFTVAAAAVAGEIVDPREFLR
jgi:3-isopropylmalate/(R)-2-methylmalate dehydratase large subunit